MTSWARTRPSASSSSTGSVPSGRIASSTRRWASVMEMSDLGMRTGGGKDADFQHIAVKGHGVDRGA